MASDGAGSHKDPVTGELISKTCVYHYHRRIEHDRIPNSELKRREKQRERDARKAEKVAAAPPPQDGSANEDDLNPNVSHLAILPSLSETGASLSNTLNFAPGRS